MRFTFEAQEAIGIVGKQIRQDFQCDVAVEPGVARAIHLAHAPGADQPEDFIGAKARAGRQGHAGRLDATVRCDDLLERFLCERIPADRYVTVIVKHDTGCSVSELR